MHTFQAKCIPALKVICQMLDNCSCVWRVGQAGKELALCCSSIQYVAAVMFTWMHLKLGSPSTGIRNLGGLHFSSVCASIQYTPCRKRMRAAVQLQLVANTRDFRAAFLMCFTVAPRIPQPARRPSQNTSGGQQVWESWDRIWKLLIYRSSKETARHSHLI